MRRVSKVPWQILRTSMSRLRVEQSDLKVLYGIEAIFLSEQVGHFLRSIEEGRILIAFI
jgi:hypothetical protein